MRKNKDEQSRISTRVFQIGNCHDIGGELNAGQVLDVFVMGVDVIGELDLPTVSIVYHFFKHPHADIVFIVRKAQAVSTYNVGNGRSPIATANDANLTRPSKATVHNS